ncbi:hypothetical protein ACWDZ4_20110 [Streptomyces sp. NPDC003016]
MSAAERRTLRRRRAAELRTRRRQNRAYRDMTERVKVSDYLTMLGMDEKDIDRYGSWAGRHVASEYRAAHHRHQPRQTRMRTKPCKGHPNGRWIKVFIYRLTDPALPTGCGKYQRTAEYVPAA